MAQQTQNLWTILAEEIYDASETAYLAFDLFEPRGHGVFNCIQPQVDLLNVPSDGSGRGVHLFLSGHPLFDSVDSITDAFNGAGDEPHQFIVV